MVIKIAECTDASYSAWCPALPGCAVRAKSEQEARRRIRDAVSGYLASLDVALPRELDRRFQAELEPAT
jgi:predicted RNase H-like HicB family nuclease